MARKRFFIIDGYGHIFRAYYGVRGLDNNAVFGFTTMLRKLLNDEKPDYIAVAMDPSGPTFRSEIYPEYKANRSAMPEDLRPQIPLIKRLIEAMNIPTVMVENYEADDVIGTLSHKAPKDIQTIIVTADKDMLQLVKGDQVIFYDPKKDVRVDEAGVPDYYGVRADQIIDLLAIWGDTSDNVPGIVGVGEKGAKGFLAKYDTIEGIYANLDKLTPKKREGFENGREQLEISKDLVTIRTNLDIEFDAESFAACEPNFDALTALYEELDFKSLLKDLPVRLKRIEREYELLDDVDRLKTWISKIREQGRMVFDVETTSLDAFDADLVGVALATEAGAAAYVPLRHVGQDNAWTEEAEALLKPLFADSDIQKIAHNAKYDLAVLRALGWDIAGRLDDTMLMNYLIEPTENRHGLDALAELKLKYQTIHYEDVCGQGADQVTFDQVEPKQACQYAAEDADICIQLYDLFEPELRAQNLERVYNEIERPLIPVLARMENTGILIDTDYLASMSADMTERISILEQEIYELAGKQFNLNSTKQLGQILFEDLGLTPTKKTTKTKSYSTSQDVLEKLAKEHPLPAKMLDYRMLTKLKSTYVDALPGLVHAKTGRVHSSFNQFVTVTGRLSSNNPNLQNIPIRSELGSEIRRAFMPKGDWTMVVADYSQIELRLMAHFSGDKTLIEAFQSGEDIHRRTASEIMDKPQDEVTPDMRAAAKSINFGLIYGMGAFRLAGELGISRKEAKAYIDAYFEKMPRVLSFRDEVIDRAREAGEIRTHWGRKRDLPELASRNRNLQNQGERLAVNTLIQGTAAEVIKLAMIHLIERLDQAPVTANLLLQVHDELVLECRTEDVEEVTRILEETMASVGDFEVPLVAEAHQGPNWKEAK